MAVEIDLAHARLHCAGEHIDQRGGACFGKSDHRGDRAGRRGERKIGQRLFAVDAEPHSTRLQLTGDGRGRRCWSSRCWGSRRRGNRRRSCGLLVVRLVQPRGRHRFMRLGFAAAWLQGLYRAGESRADVPPGRRWRCRAGGGGAVDGCGWTRGGRRRRWSWSSRRRRAPRWGRWAGRAAAWARLAAAGNAERASVPVEGWRWRRRMWTHRRGHARGRGRSRRGGELEDQPRPVLRVAEGDRAPVVDEDRRHPHAVDVNPGFAAIDGDPLLAVEMHHHQGWYARSPEAIESDVRTPVDADGDIASRGENVPMRAEPDDQSGAERCRRHVRPPFSPRPRAPSPLSSRCHALIIDRRSCGPGRCGRAAAYRDAQGRGTGAESSSSRRSTVTASTRTCRSASFSSPSCGSIALARSARTRFSVCMPSAVILIRTARASPGSTVRVTRSGILEPAHLGGHGRLRAMIHRGQVADARFAVGVDRRQQARLRGRQLHLDALGGIAVEPCDDGEQIRAKTGDGLVGGASFGGCGRCHGYIVA